MTFPMIGVCHNCPSLPDRERAASEAIPGVQRPTPASSLPREPQGAFPSGPPFPYTSKVVSWELGVKKEVLQLLHPNFTDPHLTYLIP